VNDRAVLRDAEVVMAGAFRRQFIKKANDYPLRLSKRVTDILYVTAATNLGSTLKSCCMQSSVIVRRDQIRQQHICIHAYELTKIHVLQRINRMKGDCNIGHFALQCSSTKDENFTG
jgi:hypothetical protein